MPCMRKALCAQGRQQQTRKDEDHMKKFLSLLLALTLVLSLVVVPARADADTYAFAGTEPSINVSATGLEDNKVDKGTEVTFTLNASGLKVTKNGVDLGSPAYRLEYQWVGATAVGDDTVAKVTPTSAGTLNVSCTIKAYDGSTKLAEKVVPATAITVNDKITATDVASVIFNHRTYNRSNDGSFTVYYLSTENGKIATPNKDEDWSIASTSNPAVTLTAVTKISGGVQLSLSKSQGTGKPDLVGTVDVTCTEATVGSGKVTVSSPTTAANYREGMTLTLSVHDSTNTASQNVHYVWSAKKDTAANFSTITVTDNKWTPTVDGSYVIKRTVYEGSVADANVVGENTSDAIVIGDEIYKAQYVQPKTAVTANSDQLLTFNFYENNLIKNTLLNGTSITWKVEGNGAVIGAAGSTSSSGLNKTYTGTGANEARLFIANPTSSVKVTATFTYKDKVYTVTFPNIGIFSVNATLDSTYYGAGTRSYTNSDDYRLIPAADTAVKNTAGTQLTSGDYVRYLSINAGSFSGNGVGTFNRGTTSTSFTPTPANSFGKATFTGTATTNAGKKFVVTFSIPVTPVPVNSFDSQTAEPVSTTTTNTNYKVSAPYGYTKFYVLGNSNSLTSSQTVDYSRYSASQLNSMGYTYTTIPSTYFSTSGQCTLYVIAWNDTTASSTYSKYYCGPMTVTQTNYNIQYNGVAGETVQFAQSDFTDFMNEVAEARGDASKTKSYPYVTFDYVTFSLPTTAQGTLYYGGTAMSTSNSSGAFNTRTKVTNLDSVTFVPNAKTSAKTITLNFTLYATRYSSSSTSHGTTVPYSGSVVINLVREDIKYTVSQGDSVRFDESDFLSYLRSTKGYSSNYTIDYVTFDQSAVSAVNEGSLYTYYNGYNYGGSVKTTDKFYYSATASQNALSDVAFLASRYAKTGETVYIPFTIYARYGTTGTGTRQLTGTVAIKIGQTMNFIDVKTTDYFYNSVKWAVGKNITNGTSSTTFSPYKSCTRAEIVTFLWRAAGSPEPTITRNPFRDVNAVTHSSYYKAILWASQKGITSGTSATAFSPDQVCTRAQIVTFLYRYAGQPSGYYSNPFKDVGATSEASYYNAILWAVGKGITTGTSATTFSPYASCNRAEAVTFLYRYTNGL